jgi:hypothetical protein
VLMHCRTWFTLYTVMELVYHVPLSFWAIGALWRGKSKFWLYFPARWSRRSLMRLRAFNPASSITHDTNAPEWSLHRQNPARSDTSCCAVITHSSIIACSIQPSWLGSRPVYIGDPSTGRYWNGPIILPSGCGGTLPRHTACESEDDEWQPRGSFVFFPTGVHVSQNLKAEMLDVYGACFARLANNLSQTTIGFQFSFSSTACRPP